MYERGLIRISFMSESVVSIKKGYIRGVLCSIHRLVAMLIMCSVISVSNCTRLLFLTVILAHKRGRLFCEGGTYVTDFI